MPAPGPLTTTTEVPPVVTAMFSKVMLARGIPYLHYGRPAMRKSLPKNSGTSMTFRRNSALALATTPLAEGVVPSGKQVAKTDITTRVEQWGDYITLTDYLEMTVESEALADNSRLLGEQAGQTIDSIFGATFAAGASVFYGGNAANRAALTTITHKVDIGVLRRAFRYLATQNARRFTRLISATDKVGTLPVREAYWAVTTPEVGFTLNTLTGWKDISTYSSTDGALPGEIGSFEGIRFLESSQAVKYLDGGGAAVGDVQSNGGTNADVHTIIVFGMDSTGIVPLGGSSFENIIHPKSSGGPANPLNQYGTQAWKRTGSQLILNDNFMTRIEVTVGDVAP